MGQNGTTKHGGKAGPNGAIGGQKGANRRKKKERERKKKTEKKEKKRGGWNSGEYLFRTVASLHPHPHLPGGPLSATTENGNCNDSDIWRLIRVRRRWGGRGGGHRRSKHVFRPLVNFNPLFSFLLTFSCFPVLPLTSLSFLASLFGNSPAYYSFFFSFLSAPFALSPPLYFLFFFSF